MDQLDDVIDLTEDLWEVVYALGKGHDDDPITRAQATQGFRRIGHTINTNRDSNRTVTLIRLRWPRDCASHHAQCVHSDRVDETLISDYVDMLRRCSANEAAESMEAAICRIRTFLDAQEALEQLDIYGGMSRMSFG